jgi:hypothetical protein
MSKETMKLIFECLVRTMYEFKGSSGLVRLVYKEIRNREYD